MSEQTNEVQETPAASAVEVLEPQGEATAETGAETASGAEEENRVPKGMLKRIDKLTARLHQQEEYVRSLEAKLQEKPAEDEAELSDAERLKRDILREIKAEEAKKAEHAKANADAVERQKAFAARLDEAEAESQGIREKVMDADDIAIHPDAADLILESPVGVYLAEYFADNPSEAESLFKMSDQKRAIKLARIEARIEVQRETKKASKSAPTDLATPQAKATDAMQHKTPDSMSFDEYRAWRSKKG